VHSEDNVVKRFIRKRGVSSASMLALGSFFMKKPLFLSALTLNCVQRPLGLNEAQGSYSRCYTRLSSTVIKYYFW